MNKKRNAYLYHLVGIITKKTKVKHKSQPDTYYWKLSVEIQFRPDIRNIQIYPNSLENQAVWEAIESNQYLGKRYDLQCRNWKGNYYLVNWEYLGSAYLEKDKEEEYEQ